MAKYKYTLKYVIRRQEDNDILEKCDTFDEATSKIATIRDNDERFVKQGWIEKTGTYYIRAEMVTP